MKIGDKHNKKNNINHFNVIALFTIILTILLILSTIIYVIITNNQIVYASSEAVEAQKILIEKQEQIDIFKYISENTHSVEKDEIIVETIDLEYTTTYEEDSALAKGTLQVIQEGRDGKQEVTIRKKYIDGVLVSEEIIKTEITRATINKVVKIGTGSHSNKYKAKVGDKLYVTSDMLTMRKDKNEDSEKIKVLKLNSKVEVLEISGNWYKIKSNGLSGWVQSSSLTNIDPNVSYAEGLSRKELLDKLSFDMILNKKSGLSLEQFKKVLSDSKDKNRVFENNAEYFYYIEKEYGINGIFVAAIGIHESGWGTSKISLNKKNLFGYGANDSDPYNNAYNFTTYSEGIDLVARVLVKYYINPPGTKIYDGTASGKYFTSSTLSGVGNRYASDSNWANGVYKWMEYLYNKI